MKHAKNYLRNWHLSYLACREENDSSNSHNEADKISQLQKQLNDQITKSVWEEKERVRIQERIKHLQNRHQVSRRTFTRIERACVAIGKTDVPFGEISITDSEIDNDDIKQEKSNMITDELKKTTDRYEQQMQQLFTTLQEERRIHQSKLEELTSRMGKLQEQSERLRTTNVSLSHQLLHKSSAETPPVKNPASLTKLDANSNDENMTSDDDTKPSATKGTISTTMEKMLEKYNELDEDSKKALMHHAITSNNETLQRRLMLLHDDQSKN